MAPPKIFKEKFEAAVKSMTDIGVDRQDVSRVLKNLLELFDYNWEHIEADGYRTLADAIYDDPVPKDGRKRQANKTKNLDSNHSNKKLKIKQHYGKPTSEIHDNEKRELSEAPLQQAGICEGEAIGNQMQLPSRLLINEPNKQTDVVKDTSMDGNSSALLFRDQDLQIETPLAVICPQVLDSSPLNGSSYMPPNNHTRLRGICSSGDVAGVSQSSASMQIAQHQLSNGAKKLPHDINDITKGEECVSIPIVNDVGNGILPPPFHYIPHNITFQNAYVNLSLARIGDDNCCSDCSGDCLAQPLPCPCAAETGGEFAYTRDGLLKEFFLDTCVSMIREPHKHPCFYCKICPLEQNNIEVNTDLQNTKVNPDPCKGHIIRKFIKECWSKCGCTKNCGNRVVQRGITRHLQVFLTPGEKGWGLRAAEELPQGAFVCEYVGEILTNNELHYRNIQKTGKAKHTYPVYLDADWGTEGFLKDEEALCLDGTFYGNVARFINHRCFDANIIEIPVEIESPDHHYYHLAFFTTRKVERFEELTWDYGVDFDDVNHPVKAFKCCCGSKFCRDKSRRLRSKSRALVLL